MVELEMGKQVAFREKVEKVIHLNLDTNSNLVGIKQYVLLKK